MAYDFPSSPTNGQQYTPAGGQTYTWDSAGTKWTVTGTGLSGLPTASTTDVLTGTSTSVAVTPDALAALWEHGGSIASAATISIPEGGLFLVTGTTNIGDIDWATDKAGRVAWLVFNGALTLVHSTNLNLPGQANILTAAGDRALFISEGSDVARCMVYSRAATAPTATAGSLTLSGTSPVVNLIDTDTSAQCAISADNSTGSININADNTNGVPGSAINLSVDGATLVGLTATALGITPNVNVTGTVTSAATTAFSATNGVSVFSRTGSAGAAPLQVSRPDANITGQYLAQLTSASGQCGSIETAGGTGTSTLYNTVSDGRLKPVETRRPLDNSGEIIDALNPLYFEWTTAPGWQDHGFIAQEVYLILPQGVSKGDDNPNLAPGDPGFHPWGMQYGRMEDVLVAELKDVRARLAVLEAAAAPARSKK